MQTISYHPIGIIRSPFTSLDGAPIQPTGAVGRKGSVELDSVGRQVWELCDGEHTLREMAEEFRKRHKLTRMEAEWSLRNYLKDLGRRGLVGFVVEKREE